MNYVDWTNIFPICWQAQIVFSSLARPPYRNVADANVVAIELPGGLFIDVEWVRKLNRFVVTLYRDDFDEPIKVAEAENIYDVIGSVLQFGRMAYALFNDRVSIESATSEDGIASSEWRPDSRPQCDFELIACASELSLLPARVN